MTRSSVSEAALRRMERRVADFVTAHTLLRPGQRVLLLLSGGADSMALLAFTRQCDRDLSLGLEVVALHVDYATRGADSVRDRRLVEEACRVAGMHLEVVALKEQLEGPDFQERARRLRLDAARRLLDSGRCDVVATGHNLDDQAETVLYRLAKYGAPSALVGMPPRADWLVRPLLCLRATEVREYCRARGIAYGDDFTNAEEKYARNVVRLSALPQLERLNPRVVESLGAAAEAAREQQRLLTELVDEAWVRVVHDAPLAESEQQGTQPAVDLDALAREPEALRVLLLRRLAQAALGDDTLLQRRVTQALTALAAGRSGTRCVSLRGGWEAVREYRRLSLRRRPLPAQGRTAPSRCAPLTVKLPAPSCGEAASGATTGALSSSAVVTFCARRLLLLAQPGGRPSDAVGRAALGVDRLPAALTLRHPCTGDRFVPLGLAAETSVARFLREQKVALSARAHALVLEVEGQVAWVETPGVSPAGRVAHSFRVTESSVFSIFVREQAT